jgi:uncharacterized circularly permuted ATP-grasp superfamily protein
MSSYPNEALARTGSRRNVVREVRTTKPDDLEALVANRKRQLIAEIIEHKTNSSRFGAAEAIDKIKLHLSELAQIIKKDDWATLSEGTRQRLAEWIAR